MSPRVSHGTRDANGVWHPDNPDLYPPMDVAGILPWSVLRQDSKPWQDRKRWWYEQGVRDETASRVDARAMIATGRHGRISGGVSRFDPVLAELMYSWFCPRGGLVLDPFAGGPVRGLVAAHLGLRYTGFDLSADQVHANRQAAKGQPGGAMWQPEDARTALPVLLARYDYALTCPPYHNRERYSNDPRDLSAMRWDGFLEAHSAIVAGTLRCLRDDAFATWVVGDVRGPQGHLRDLPGHVIRQFRAHGAHLCNEQILVSPSGTLAKTMRPPWEACRTTTRVHQRVLTFVKGDRREATRAIREASC